MRPEIRNGTWYVGDRPEFYMGVWLYNSDMQWGAKANPLGIDHPAYTTPPGEELFRSLGFNSSQISSAHSQIGAVLRGFPLPRGKNANHKGWRDVDADISRFFKRFGDMPMVLDFAFGYSGMYSEEAKRLLGQRKAGSVWHEFVPFCPHVPEGWKYYRDYFEVLFAMQAGYIPVRYLIIANAPHSFVLSFFEVIITGPLAGNASQAA